MSDLDSEFSNLLEFAKGGSSDTGQPIRKLLGIGQHERLTNEQLLLAKSFIARVKGGAP